MQPSNVPYLTFGVAAVSAWLWFAPELSGALVYRRDLVLGGEVWRLLTAPLVHLSSSHLAWNLAVFLWAASCCERRCPQGLVRALAASALLAGLVALAFQPQLAVYGGLSGLATAAVVLLALLERREPVCPRPARALWTVVLLLAVAKPLVELGLPGPLFAVADPGGWRPLPSAHLLGALSGFWAAGAGAGRGLAQSPGLALPGASGERSTPSAR